MTLPQIPSHWGESAWSLEPIIFDNPQQLEQAIDLAAAALRRTDADRFRVLADDYERTAEREAVQLRGRLLGIAGGLRVAAALLENQAKAA